jgi:hypothetical protein
MRVFIALALALSPVLAYGQATFGTITGTVTDSTGAVVPNVSLEVTNEGTNISRTVVSDSAGN